MGTVLEAAMVEGWRGKNACGLPDGGAFSF